MIGAARNGPFDLKPWGAAGCRPGSFLEVSGNFPAKRLWAKLHQKCFAGNFPETSRKLPGRQPAAPQNLRMGCCALHQSIRGQKPPIGKCPQIWAILPHCGAMGPTSLQETSRKLPGRQPAAPQNLRLSHCGRHQSIRGGKLPIGKCPQNWAIWPHCGAIRPASALRGVSWKLLGKCRGPQACTPAPRTARGAGLTAKAHTRPGPRGPQVVWVGAWVLVLLGWQCTFCQFGPANGLLAGSFQESSSHPKHVLGGGLPAPKAPAPLGPSPVAHKWCGARCGACRWPAVVRLI